MLLAGRCLDHTCRLEARGHCDDLRTYVNRNTREAVVVTATLHVWEDQGRLRLRFRSPDSYEWHEILDAFKEAFVPHAERSFRESDKTWSLPLRCRTRLHKWADAYFSATYQVWEDEEDEEPRASRSEQRDSTGGARAYGSALEEAYRVLHLLPTAPNEVLDAVHRTLIKIHHPDCGGSHEEAVRINLAMQEIRRHRP